MSRRRRSPTDPKERAALMVEAVLALPSAVWPLGLISLVNSSACALLAALPLWTWVGLRSAA